VADLLECLIQIKGVADTPRRLELRLEAARRLSGAGGANRGLVVAKQMAEAEACFGRCLSLMLDQDRASLPGLPKAIAGERETGSQAGTGELDDAGWPAQFRVRRVATVAVLEQCSAEQLGRIGLAPSRGPLTVADLVALMLAHDTDCLGLIGPGEGSHRATSGSRDLRFQ
jgi:hypothetical protein